MAEAGTIDFELARFEHLVETQRGHIVRVSGTWTTPEGRDLPHPTLVAGNGDDLVNVAPLPIPGQDPPHADGTSPWLATYSIPKRLFGEPTGPRCRLRPAPERYIDLPALEVPADRGEPAVVGPGRPPAPLAAAADGPRLTMPPVAPVAAPPPPPGGKDLHDLYLGAVRTHRRLIFAIVAVALLGSFIGLAIRSPTYRASAQLLVTPLPKDETGLQGLPEVRAGSDPDQTIATVAQLVRSRDAATATARTLGNGWTTKTVLRRISVDPVGQSNVLAVSAQADDAKVAARLANTFARTSLSRRDARVRALAGAAIARTQQQVAGIADQNSPEAQALQVRIAELERVRTGGDPTLEQLRAAAVPRSPAGLPPLGIVVLTGLAGLVIAIAAAVLLDLLGPSRLDSEHELSELYPLPILARMPLVSQRRDASRAGELREAMRMLATQLELDDSRRHRAVMFTSASSGDGKTTTALAFSRALASAGRAVILVDLDLRRPQVADRLGVTAELGIEAVVAGRVALADALVGVQDCPGLEVLPPAGPTDLSTLEAIARHLPDLVEGATALADYVVLDTPPVGEISDALTFARSVDDVLVVCRLGRTAQPSFEAMRDLLERVGSTPTGLVVVGGRAAAAAAYPVATGDFAPPP